MSFQQKINLNIQEKYRRHKHPVSHHKKMVSRKGLKQQRGIVIILALLIMALITTISYAMMARLNRDTVRAKLLQRHAIAMQYAEGSLYWAMDQLLQNWIHQKKDRLIDSLPMTSKREQVHNYFIQSTIFDAQARFNLNNLSQAGYEMIFKQLIHLAYPEMNNDETQQVIEATRYWLMQSRGNRTADRYYLELPTPYRPAHRLFGSVSEWGLVRGVTPKLYQSLRPYITALPEITPINIQTAPAVLIASLSENLTLTTAMQLVDYRKQQPFTSLSSFLNLDSVRNHGISEKGITTLSHYFLVETQVDIENQHILLYTMIVRETEIANKPKLRIIWQSENLW